VKPQDVAKPLVEFIVEGTPRSLQGSSRGIDAWKEIVKEIARKATNDGETRVDFVDVSVRIFHYCFDWGYNDGDLDNIAKPILDAMCGVAIFNDNQVRHLTLRRTDLDLHPLTRIEGATPLLADRLERTLSTKDGFVYIAVERDAEHGSIL
jgi:crossover junction endodeoxyribonuclease RusA